MLLRRYHVKGPPRARTHRGRRSAKIYLFPARGRCSPATGRVFADERRVESHVVDLRPQPAAEILSASAWYHQEALEAERKRDDD